jgi:hypothetical protein
MLPLTLAPTSGDGVIRASHSARVSASIKLEHLFASLDDTLLQLMSFVESNPTEVAVVFLDTDCDPQDWAAMPGNSWQRVHSMLQPHVNRLLPYDERLQTIGAITGSGRNIALVCQQLRDV